MIDFNKFKGKWMSICTRSQFRFAIRDLKVFSYFSTIYALWLDFLKTIIFLNRNFHFLHPYFLQLIQKNHNEKEIVWGFREPLIRAKFSIYSPWTKYPLFKNGNHPRPSYGQKGRICGKNVINLLICWVFPALFGKYYIGLFRLIIQRMQNAPPDRGKKKNKPANRG